MLITGPIRDGHFYGKKIHIFERDAKMYIISPMKPRDFNVPFKGGSALGTSTSYHVLEDEPLKKVRQSGHQYWYQQAYFQEVNGPFT
mmetsp:Transcript_38117/g.58146  ORF Transcript_38117/g.58146 Transcript_38117/m.58146 type:complete len:87 (+) Transcript_38117:290-550(+)